MGDVVVGPEAATPPRREVRAGTYVSLAPTAPGDADELYACSHGDAVRERLWAYMAYGPFADVAAMAEWLATCAASRDATFCTVTDLASGTRVGMLSWLNVVPGDRRIEIGNIWYCLAAQRTKANTEACYLLLTDAFESYAYRRVEGKCDSLNQPSRDAALRLGFRFEGIFRQHMVRNGRNRDSAYFSILDSEWPAASANIRRWLYDNPDGVLSLTRLNGAG